MRVAPVLLLIAATFLAASEALSTTTDSNKVKTSQVILPSGPSLRLLRKHNKVVDEDEDSSEGRTLTDLQMAEMEKFAEKLGMNWARVQSGTMYLQRHAKYAEYQETMNKYIAINQKIKAKKEEATRKAARKAARRQG
ncbi:hypothetical protein PHYSODRAFT_286533 [Phytophthora sojae]|uniref:RxLR effector protein n=2 Tax=Phytophthora sojae TaxID=67593 RepID=G4ZSV6_PHYSP|nr:hypothetical protein PHYSODRAFT_286533 [Phytophthora sojae]AEK80897.1 Avh200 [Phytophthora sojae]AEK80899.1 Avh200 [Phytophthora sojae]EGZ13041.1 hypothetical protein PHYSODRAFT_286533 [Phytophthora sojae]|eukprot:XP_009530470.1 hypothetical protein PHYSODRAFT_286533 [Phytophthora sojae]